MAHPSSSSFPKPQWVGRGKPPRLSRVPARAPSVRSLWRQRWRSGSPGPGGVEAPGGVGRGGGCGSASARQGRVLGVQLWAPGTRGARRAQWLAMLLSPSLLLLLLLLGEPRGYAEDVAAAFTPERLLEWWDKGIFIIQSESLKECIQAGKSVLTLENCKQANKHMLWKWVSNHGLFNIGGSGCLGLNFSAPEQPLSLYECDSTLVSLRWRCNRKMITGPLQYSVQVAHDNTVVASRKYFHKWISYVSGGGDICEYLHKDLHTIKGNTHGMPCVFPFQYNHQWHHECTREGREDDFLWCATTSRYERDEKWGFCPDPTSAEVSCDTIWEKDLSSHICYQFNLLSSLSWSEAHSSCQMQGGALLSITDETEENFIREHMSSKAVEVWIGLNQLDEHAGWQWSDGTPLSYLNWSPEVNFEPFVENHCGTFSSFMPSAWRSRDCESTLPYICKKYLNHTDHEIVEKDAWKYYATHCEPGWNPYNRNCYKLRKEEKTWHKALRSCQADNSALMDITSLAEVEFLVTFLGDENASETWIGLSSNKIPVSFEWSNDSSVIFTNWHTLEPQIFPNRSQLCVSAEQSEGHWKVKNCEETLFYICKKAGHVLSDAESGCQEGWERHGGFCYKTDTVLRSFDQASSGYYCPPALVTITNRFEQAFITSLISSVVKMKDSYFWIALQDQNDTGEYTWKPAGRKPEPVQYTHWNAHQPSYSGGCVAMRGRHPLGSWEVKDCRHFKAMSLCKQPVENQETAEYEERWPFHPCYLDWESEPGLASCFKVFHSEKVLMKRTWREAEAFCEEFGAHLASFAHIEEENFVNELLHSKFNWTEERQFWIGFNKRNPLNAGSWEWSDRTPVVSSFLDNNYFGEDARNCAVYKANKTLLPLHCGSKREWICKIPRDVKPKIPFWYQYDVPWLFYQDAEYLFHTFASEWSNFGFVCSWLHSDLLTIHSAHEQEFIHSKIKTLSKYGASWWIGLQEERANDEFRWRDGTPVIYQNWDTGRERTVNNQSQRCGFISSITGLWGSEECSVSMPSICKRKKVWLIEKKKDTPKQHGTCPKGWLYFNYKCLLLNIPKDPSSWKNWTHAQHFCAEEAGTLVAIESEVEQAFITMNLFGQTTNVWIGLQNDDYETWLNGKPVVYSNWSPFDTINIPNHNTTEVQKHIPLCALLSSNPNFHFTGKWYFEDCGKEGYGFVCEKMQDTSGHGVNTSDMYPMPNTLEYGNRTYKIINANMTWYAAIKTCLMHGAQLVSITDQYHQSFLTVVLNRLGYAHWIGLFTTDNGLNFDWSDGTKSSFTFWKDEESSLHGDCVFADTNGRWHSTACESFLQGAICHVPPETRPSEYPELCSETSIPWIKFKSNCYSFSTVLDSMSFEAAHEFCKKEGSNLLTIKDEAENAFLLEELFAFGSSVQMVWLNAQFDGNNETIKWFDGTPTDQSNWGIRKPDTDYFKPHHCVALRIPEGLWQLSPCQEKKGFICKMEADIGTAEELPEKGPSHSIIPLVVVLTLIVTVAICTLSFCIYKHNGDFFRRLAGFRNPYYPATNFSTVHLEENILISDLEKSDQ
ncbi:secretory phospholipase A2 receptor isoform X1 [Trachypithecus francoisi]|uniref:secretory phospholipase A2 receptor isoform X1 n=1 Tax=Trachypithecus francoisi TaxID=54180 RepID=UPI00141AB47D|nr:secretory phospholipase A2 receptor isoform X1 [Trachypithecus francoisi]XP_033087227.1 secretory phospholipase A2 receptor isoform X1 [Trachypithecus francoisi]XP_033087229.1 secretory phospholipase A2 receptor isoform X1 [Trachypithecus francoisi]